MDLNVNLIEGIIKNALAEDIGRGDITTDSIIPPDRIAKAHMIVKEEGVIAGLPVAERVFATVMPEIKFNVLVDEGKPVSNGTIVAEIYGPARGILTGERVALNFLQRLSGIATQTAKFAELIKFYPVKVIDTRKTTPGLRYLEKYAVRIGGGFNHRFGLDDAVLIKDNHIAVAGGIKPAVEIVRKVVPHTIRIEVETENLDQVQEALTAGVDIIMLDNMTLEEMTEAVKIIDGKAMTEASGNVSLERVVDIAKTGVNYISVGSLTHNIKSLDISLEIDLRG